MNVLRHLFLVMIFPLLLFWTGCASVPYRQGVSFVDPRLPEAPLFEAQIERGRPNRVLDKSDWVWPGSWLGKLVLWDRRVDNHQIGEETEEMMRRYLAHNDLEHVKVRLNMYAPRDEFRRTVRNRSVGVGWRYTVGMIAWLQYTILPGRILGGDNYNPYSNTINLYSDIPAIAVHEGGNTGLLYPGYALPIYAGSVTAGHVTGRIRGARRSREVEITQSLEAFDPTGN